ncbi:hypothetical protein LTR85_007335 [Meristemomyces frigidus]|nr:hypothetical protein LTR85_007335 [Meristemomyces frigidus]
MTIRGQLVELSTGRSSIFAPSATSKIARLFDSRTAMDGGADAFIPGRGVRPHPIDTNHPAASLFPSSMWAAQATQSAPMVGLGVDFNNTNHAQASGSTPTQGPLPNTQTLHATQSGTLPASHTFPITQQQFRGARDAPSQPRVLPPNTQHVQQNVTTRAGQDLSNASASTTSHSFGDSYTTDTSSEDDLSQISTISPHYLTLHPEQANMTGEVFMQASSARGFKRFALDPSVEIEEVFKGACNTVAGMNPDYYKMPFGTRVINIKTDFANNVHYSVQTGVWSTLEKVSERIMQVWDARRDPKEKVLFLFAINGARNFCGIAEMSGPWDASGHIDGWSEKTKGAGSVGTIPLTWVYMKNVPYTLFDGVRQERNNQSVVNMWNGMHFDTEAGRRVVRIYVEYPHDNNILAGPRFGYDNRPQRITNGAQNQRPGYGQGNQHAVPNVRAIRGGHGGQDSQSAQNGKNGRGGYTAGRRDQSNKIAHDWRQGRQPNRDQSLGGRVLGELDENEPTPTTSRFNNMSINTNTPPPHFDGPAETAATPRIGQLISCVVDEHGNLVPISPHPQQTHGFTHMPSQASFRNSPVEMTSAQQQRTQAYHRGAFHGGARGGGMRGDMHSARSLDTRGIYETGPQTTYYANPNMDGSHESQDSLRHAASMANMAPQQASMPAAFGAPTLHHAASAADFIPQAQRGQMLRNVANAHLWQQNQQGGYGKPAPPSILSSGYTAVGANEYTTHWGKRQAAKPASDSTDPSLFKETYSISGAINPRSKPTPLRNAEETPTRDSGSNSAMLHRKAKEWAKKTPTQASFAYPMPVDALAVPLENQATYYHLMADKAGITKKLAGMSMDDEQEYYLTLAKKAELEKMITALTMSDASSQIHSDGSPCRKNPRGSSEADSTIQSTSSIERHNISPVRAADGRPLDSVSRQGLKEPKSTRKGNRARNAPYTNSYEARMKDEVARLVGTPTSSVKVNHHTSTAPAMSDTESVASFKTNPFDGQSEGDGSGGCRLDN